MPPARAARLQYCSRLRLPLSSGVAAHWLLYCTVLDCTVLYAVACPPTVLPTRPPRATTGCPPCPKPNLGAAAADRLSSTLLSPAADISTLPYLSLLPPPASALWPLALLCLPFLSPACNSARFFFSLPPTRHLRSLWVLALAAGALDQINRGCSSCRSKKSGSLLLKPEPASCQPRIRAKPLRNIPIFLFATSDEPCRKLVCGAL